MLQNNGLKPDRTPVGTTTSTSFECTEGETYKRSFLLDTTQIAPGDYIFQIVAFEPDNIGNQIRHDYVPKAVGFTIYTKNQLNNFVWNHNAWGHHVIPELKETK